MFSMETTAIPLFSGVVNQLVSFIKFYVVKKYFFYSNDECVHYENATILSFFENIGLSNIEQNI